MPEEITDSARFAEVAGARTGETPSGPWHLFRADVLELVVVTLPPERDRLLIDVWTPAGGVRRIER